MARLLFVHAHPDDETLTCGTTMAHHVARGDEVHVLTCTLGEEGEVIPPELAHLEGAVGDPLGAVRRDELSLAMARLGVQHAVLGEDPATGRRSAYRDSGMVGMPSAHHPRAFCRADLDEAGELVAAHVRALRPDVVVTYDQHGGYGHPDHIQTRRVTLVALRLLPVGQRPGRVFEILTPRSWAEQDRSWLSDHVPPGDGLTVPDLRDPYPSSVVADRAVSHVVLDPAQVERQAEALRAHRTQVIVRDGFYALSNLVAARLSGREGYRRIDPATGSPGGAPPGTGGDPAGPGSWADGLMGETVP